MRSILNDPTGTVAKVLPVRLRRVAAPRWRKLTRQPQYERVVFGNLRRTAPFSRDYGFSRGTPIDRYYIDEFFRSHADDIRGRVLEVVDSTYTIRFGDTRVTSPEVLDIEPDNPQATFVDDLVVGATLPTDAFDCVILTQTLQLISDVPAAIATTERILKPGGVVLATVPGVSQMVGKLGGMGDPWFWGFSDRSVRHLFGHAFNPASIDVEVFGNVLTSAAFLYGLAAEELSEGELAYQDPEYQFLIAVRATKPSPDGSADQAVVTGAIVQ